MIARDYMMISGPARLKYMMLVLGTLPEVEVMGSESP